VSMKDFIVPATGFSSYGEFFTRETRPGARPVASPGNTSVVASPVDATVEVLFDSIGLNDTFHIKSEKMPLNISSLLGGHPLTPYFIGGQGALLMLGVTDYHRWHVPWESAEVLDVAILGNFYFSTPPGIPWFPDYGYYFHRNPIFLRTLGSTRPVSMVMVPVGIAEYGSVVPFVTQGDGPLTKGDPLGMFDLGGSAVYIAFANDLDVQWDVVEGQHVKACAKLAEVNQKK